MLSDNEIISADDKSESKVEQVQHNLSYLLPHLPLPTDPVIDNEINTINNEQYEDPQVYNLYMESIMQKIS